jgi:hypothetical protein
VAESLAVARSYVEAGQKALAPFAGSEAATALEEAAEHLLSTVNAAG